MTVEQSHEEKETLAVDVLLPGHEPRTATPLFERTRKALIARDGGCWICGRTEAEAGPLEAHHFGVERSYAEAPIDWNKVKADFPHFDWATFDPKSPYAFVDDMMAQGLLLCAEHHRGRDAGVHALPWPLFVMQRYLKDGYKFSDLEVIHHAT